MNTPDPDKVYVPDLTDPPKLIPPPHSDKRYAVFMSDWVLLDTDEFREVFLLISAGHATSVHDRGVARINKYVSVVPYEPKKEQK